MMQNWRYYLIKKIWHWSESTGNFKTPQGYGNNSEERQVEVVRYGKAFVWIGRVVWNAETERIFALHCNSVREMLPRLK